VNARRLLQPLALLRFRTLSVIDWLVVAVYTCTSETLLGIIALIIAMTTAVIPCVRRHSTANAAFVIGFLTERCKVSR